MKHSHYHICDDFIYILAKLGLHERKAAYSVTHLNAWWWDEINGKHLITKLMNTIYRLNDLKDGRKLRVSLIKLYGYWKV